MKTRRFVTFASLMLAFVGICRCYCQTPPNPPAATSPAPEAVTKRLKAANESRDILEDKEGTRAALVPFKIEAEKLIVEYPDRPEPWEALFEVAIESQDADAKALFSRIMTASAASENIRAAATKQAARLDRVGKPLDLKFTAMDGRSVDVAALRGKIVVIGLWATWCRPSMQKLPGMKKMADRFKDQGVEFVGVNIDKDRAKLDAIIDREGIFWPQYFDGLGWKNAIAQQLGIVISPSVWLVDQQGILRDTYCVEDLQSKLEGMVKARP